MDIWQRLESQDKSINELKERLTRTVESEPNQMMMEKLDYLSRRVEQLSYKVLKDALPSTAMKKHIQREVFEIIRAHGGTIKDFKPIVPNTLDEYRDKLIRSIISAVENKWHSGIINKSKKEATTIARQVACYLIREMTPLSFPEIGLILGRDHSTVMHGHARVRERIEAQPEFAHMLAELRQQIENKQGPPEA